MKRMVSLRRAVAAGAVATIAGGLLTGTVVYHAVHPSGRALANSFRDGALKTTGTDIDKLMPPVSRFGGGNRTEKKQGVIQRLSRFFEKYLGVA